MIDIKEVLRIKLTEDEVLLFRLDYVATMEDLDAFDQATRGTPLEGRFVILGPGVDVSVARVKP